MEDVCAFPTLEFVKRMAKESQIPKTSTHQVVNTMLDVIQRKFLPTCASVCQKYRCSIVAGASDLPLQRHVL